MVLQTIGFTIIMFTTNFWIAVFSIFLNGMMCSIRVQIGFLYMMEFIPVNKHPFAGSFYFVLEVTVALFGVVYFS